LLLIHPPVAKPGEPPAGLARLAFALRSRGAACKVWDASLEGLRDLLSQPVDVRPCGGGKKAGGSNNTWTHRAAAHVRENLAALSRLETFKTPDRYKQAVLELNRVISAAGKQRGVHITLANYTDPRLSPVKSGDLLQAAEQFEENPFYPFFSSRLPELMDGLRSFPGPCLVGFSVNFMSQALCAFAMAGFIRHARPETRIVMGGGLVSSWACIPGFDNPFFPLVDELAAGPGEARLLSMAGVAGPSAEKGVGMDFSDFDLDRYLSPRPVIAYPASRGCYWRKCAFCPEKYEKSPCQVFEKEAAAADVAGHVRKTGAGLIHFVDNALSPAFLKTLMRRPPGAAWYGFVRATPHLTDPAFVEGLRQSGCVMLKLGIESGDQTVLDALNKGVRIETVSRALETIRAAGISVYAYLLFGTPAETLERARKTLSFTLAHADCIDFLNLAIFNLPALSEDARGLETRRFYPGDLSLYREFVHPRGWHRREVRRFLEKEFRQPASIRAKLAQDPPFFTSNHAPFFSHLY